MSTGIPCGDSRFPARQVAGVLYRLARPEDAEAVAELMLTEFCARMPLYRHLGATAAADVQSLALVPDILARGESLVAAEPDTGQLLGVRLSATECRTDPAELRVHPLVSDPKLAARYPKEALVMRAVAALWTEAAYSARYPTVDRALAARFLTVRESHAGRGIGRRLMELSVELGRSLGVQLMVGSTQSYYSQRIYESLGFERIHALSIPEFVDPLTGQRPFEGLAGTVHKESVLFAMRI